MFRSLSINYTQLWLPLWLILMLAGLLAHFTQSQAHVTHLAHATHPQAHFTHAQAHVTHPQAHFTQAHVTYLAHATHLLAHFTQSQAHVTHLAHATHPQVHFTQSQAHVTHPQEPCDFTHSGIGSFESDADWSRWWMNGTVSGTTFGTLGSFTEDGSRGVKAVVVQKAPWQVRIFNTGCSFSYREGKGYHVSARIRGDSGSVWSLTLQSTDPELYDIASRDFTIATSGWDTVSVVLYPDKDYPVARLRVNFKTPGTFYLDDVMMQETDCQGVIGGEAEIDSCGICAGGTTGIIPGTLCAHDTIYPDNERLQYLGVLHSIIKRNEARLYRFSGGFLGLGDRFGWKQAKARTQSGISIRFRTSAGFIGLYFAELEVSEIRKRNFGVFKNGALYRDNISGLKVEILNTDGDEAVWEVTLPSFSGVKLTRMELSHGDSLMVPDPVDKPGYYAIGNSITHGVGQADATHLTYPFLLADTMDWQLYNLGIGGSRINLDVLKNLEGRNPDYISVLWGYNDAIYGPDPLSRAHSNFSELMTRLLTDHPQSRVIAILQPFTTSTTGVNNAANTISELRAGQLAILLEMADTCDRLCVMDGWDYVTGEGDLADAVHLNVPGAAKLARGILKSLDCCLADSCFPIDSVKLDTGGTNVDSCGVITDTCMTTADTCCIQVDTLAVDSCGVITDTCESATDSCCIAVDTSGQENDTVVAVAVTGEEGVWLYPNPAADRFTLCLPEQGGVPLTGKTGAPDRVLIRIIAPDGSLRHERTAQWRREITVDVSFLERGFYYVRIVCPDANHTLKLLRW